MGRTSAWHRLWCILAKYDTEPIELWLAITTLLRGVWFLVIPFPANGVVHESPVLSLAFVAVSTLWILSLMGLEQIARRWVALASVGLRAYALLAVSLVSPVAVNVPFQAGLIAISVWLYVRLGSERR